MRGGSETVVKRHLRAVGVPVSSAGARKRSAVIRALDGLKKREVLCWVKGGRTKGGRAISNLYTIKLPPVDKSVDNFMEDAREEKARVSQRHPNIQITNIEQPVINITRPGAGKDRNRGD